MQLEQIENDHEANLKMEGRAGRRYTDTAGKEMPQRMQRFFNDLEDLGYEVTLTPLTRPETVGRTFRIYWSGVYVGQWEFRMWQKQDQRVLLYRFPKEGLKTIAEAPPSLTEEDFAGLHTVDARQLVLRPDGGKHYLHVRDEFTALELLRQWAEVIDGEAAPSVRGTARQVEEDYAKVLADPGLTPTQRKALTDARLGQGKFRAALMREFGKSCAVSGLDVPQALRASHIVPWRTSTDTERLDPKNGLLLSANLDALFDQYLITFNSHGRLIASPALSDPQREHLGLREGLDNPFCDKRWGYMRRHAEEFERRIAAGRI